MELTPTLLGVWTLFPLPPDDSLAQSPGSPASPIGINRLSLSDLSQFGYANDQLSRLQSSSSERLVQSDTSPDTHEAVADAEQAITGWKDEQASRPPNPFEAPQSRNARASQSSTNPQSCSSISEVEKPTSFPKSHGTKRRFGADGIDSQYDGAADLTRKRSMDSPFFSSKGRLSSQPRHSRRRPSQFSLHSLSDSWAKRPRLGFRKLANTVYRTGSRQLSQARNQFRRQRIIEKREYEA
ncbi:hypothetical protein B0I35DRAFT_403444 [Stachybotrys elegans]|uniref:Uncharacterized protein n=1 Tax=Stachybotrys elegans TaxID=80388 RepID=A0A8K0WVV2_9HYPO|nr:hypothetical protein B0I35DRAFT_403444 [Stachybotrys elegans]